MSVTSAEQHRIPVAYRAFFTWVDPLIALSGVYMNLFTPDTVLNAYIPSTLSQRDPAHFMLFQQLAANLLMAAFLSIVLLRYTADVKIWKILQASILLVDLTLLYSLWDAIGSQGRLSLDGMRGEDWGCAIITGTVVAMRVLFLAEFGFEPRSRTVKKD